MCIFTCMMVLIEFRLYFYFYLRSTYMTGLKEGQFACKVKLIRTQSLPYSLVASLRPNNPVYPSIFPWLGGENRSILIFPNGITTDRPGFELVSPISINYSDNDYLRLQINTRIFLHICECMYIHLYMYGHVCSYAYKCCIVEVNDTQRRLNA